MNRIKAMLAILFMGIGVLSQSCVEGSRPAYSEFADIGTAGWDPIRIIPFSPYPVDSVLLPTDRFDLILTVRHSLRGDEAALPVEIYEESALGSMGTRRISVPLRNSRGEPLGRKGVVLYEVSDTLRRDFTLPPGYELSLTPLVPQSRTRSVRAIGVSLVPVAKH